MSGECIPPVNGHRHLEPTSGAHLEPLLARLPCECPGAAPVRLLLLERKRLRPQSRRGPPHTRGNLQLSVPQLGPESPPSPSCAQEGALFSLGPHPCPPAGKQKPSAEDGPEPESKNACAQHPIDVRGCESRRSAPRPSRPAGFPRPLPPPPLPGSRPPGGGHAAPWASGTRGPPPAAPPGRRGAGGAHAAAQPRVNQSNRSPCAAGRGGGAVRGN